MTKKNRLRSDTPVRPVRVAWWEGSAPGHISRIHLVCHSTNKTWRTLCGARHVERDLHFVAGGVDCGTCRRVATRLKIPIETREAADACDSE